MPQEIHVESATWPIPLGVIEVTVQCKGNGTSGGGGGGAYAKETLNVNANNVLTLLVGPTVTPTSVSEQLFIHLSAPSASGSTGGTGGVGGILRNGGNGGSSGMTAGGGGGAAGGFSGVGGNGQSATDGGAGGIAPETEFSPAIVAGNPGGAGGAGGQDGVLYGGGGGGTGAMGGGVAGVGRQGVIILDYAFSGIGIDPQGSGGRGRVTGPYPICITNVMTSSWEHKILAGDNRYLLVGVSITTPGSATASVTYGGVALTKFVGITKGSLTSELWGLVNPAVGIELVTVSFNALTNGEGNAVSFSGVDQTNPIDSTASTTVDSNSVSALNITTVTDKAVVIDYITCNNTVITQDSSQVLIVRNECFAGNGMSRKGPISPAGTTTMSWTWGIAANSAHVAVALRQSGASAGGASAGGNWWPFFDN